MPGAESGRGRGRDADHEHDGDDRPPICPACGVTMGIHMAADGSVQHVCQECGYPDDGS
jgi:hypothetical protein